MTHEQKRKLKYPNTECFHYHNANPKGKITTDCVIRAICTVLNKSYNEVLMEMAELQCKTGLDMSENKCIDKYMQQNGWVRVKQPRKEDNTKYTGKEFCRTLMHPIYCEELNIPINFEINRVLAHIGGHHIVAIMSGQVWDHWNSTNGTIGQVWVKPA
jgi:hypothetical protein